MIRKGVEVGEAGVEVGLVRRESILDLFMDLLDEFLEQKLAVGIHSTELLLMTGEVIVILQSEWSQE
jgi:predicted ATPase